MRQRLKLIIFSCLSTLIGLAALFIIFEIILRFLPVNEGLHSLPVNDRNPIHRFEPNRTSTWSRFWNFSMTNVVKTNNYGFISNIDYDPESRRPLIAIIGGSYVEAAMVPWNQTGAARLQKRLGSMAHAYTFGASGSALSQYVAYSEYVRKEFAPDVLVIVVVGNDFDESLIKYKSAPGYHYFFKNRDGKLVLKRVDFEVSFYRKLV